MSDSEILIRRLINEGALFHASNSYSGGNSDIKRFSYKSDELVLKIYRGDKQRIENTKQREYSAYKFLTKNYFSSLPRLHSTLCADDAICLEFIPGITPRYEERTNREILKSFLLLKEIFLKNSVFSNAVDAAFSTSDMLNQIKKRVDNFDNSLVHEKSLLKDVVNRLEATKSIVFPLTSITYSFSDIGPHNMIKHDEKYIFLDLEFFGKDSAVKMFLDYILHPKNNFSFEDKSLALEHAERQFGIERDLVICSAPFFAAKWATIIARRMTLDYGERNMSSLKRNFERYLEIARATDMKQLQDKILKGG
jgi:hypothetical protein